MDLVEFTRIAALAGLLGLAAWRDALTRRIPNGLCLAGCAAGLGLAALPGGMSLFDALTGLVFGLAVLTPLYVLRVTGAGDVKLLAAVGSLLGFPGIASAAVFTLIAGGLLALIWAMRARRMRVMLLNIRAGLIAGAVDVASARLPRLLPPAATGVEVPYAVAIAVGTFVAVAWHWRAGGIAVG